MDPFSEYINYFLEKARAESTYVTDPNNVIIGETVDLLTKQDSFFPRLELLITKLKCNGFIDQRSVAQAFRFTVCGHLRRATDSTTDADMFTALKWGRELLSMFMKANTDRLLGTSVCTGFIQVGGFPEVFFDYEMFPKITTIMLVADVEVELTDTYEA